MNHTSTLRLIASMIPLLIATAALSQDKKVLIIGIDGLRPDAMMKADTPNLDALMEKGCCSLEARTSRFTVSGPGWSSMLTGVWAPKHNVPDNDFLEPAYERYPHFFARVKEKRPDLVTATFDSWEPLSMYLVPPDATDHAHFIKYEEDGDVKLTAIAAQLLAEAPLDVVFFYYADVDIAGHDHGFHPSSPEYIDEIEEVDSQLGRLLEALKRRTTYEKEDWLILVSTDHGGTLDGAHGRDEPKHRRVPYIASGSAAGRGIIHPTPNVVDIVATTMAHLGIELEKEWGLDGKSSGLKTRIEYGTNLIFNGDAEYSSPTMDPQVNHGIAGWIDEGAMSLLAYGAVVEYPAMNCPGPDQRGNNYFFGGTDGDSVMMQSIGVASLASDIDDGHIEYIISGWLGGYAEQTDFMTFSALFRDSRVGEIDRVSIGPVTLCDRQQTLNGVDEMLTGLLFRQTSGVIPRGTRTIEMILESEVGEGANDGYADNLSMMLKRRE